MYRHGPLGFWKEMRDHLVVNAKVETDKSAGSALPVTIHFDIGNIIPRDSEQGPDIVFEEILLRVGKPPDWHIEKFTNLGMDQWLSYDYRCNYIDLPDISYDIEYKISINSIFGFRKEPTKIELKLADFSLADTIKFTNSLKIHRWLDEVIKKMPEPDSNTTVGEIERNQNTTKGIISEITATEQQFTKVTNSVSGDHGDDWRSLTDAVRQYLRNTASECRALETSVSGDINNVLRNTIRVLEAEATKLNSTIESVMKKNNISDEDVGYQYRGW